MTGNPAETREASEEKTESDAAEAEEAAEEKERPEAEEAGQETEKAPAEQPEKAGPEQAEPEDAEKGAPKKEAGKKPAKKKEPAREATEEQPEKPAEEPARETPKKRPEKPREPAGEEKPKADRPGRASRDDNVIFVGKKPAMSYVMAAMTQFSGGSREVDLKARGRSISRAVDAAEVIRNRFLKDASCSIEIGTDEVRDEQGNKVNVSTISIRLAK
jgi:DNA-binding protein